MSRLTRRSFLTLTGATGLALPILSRSVVGQQAIPGATPSASPVASPEASPIVALSTVIAIEAIDFAFIEGIITAPSGVELTITITNNGRTAHDFVIDELDLHVDPVMPGETATFTTSGPAGEYPFYCSLNSHRIAGQRGTLILV